MANTRPARQRPHPAQSVGHVAPFVVGSGVFLGFLGLEQLELVRIVW